MKIRYVAWIFAASLNVTLLTGCGGGSGNDTALTDTLGKWTGSVNLSENSCPRDLPEEFNTIFFTHKVSMVLTSNDKADLTLTDSDRACYALGADTNQNEFFAVCPEATLPDFIDGHECREELTWHYTVFDPVGTNSVNPVTRTSRIGCYIGSEIQFVCLVEYRGTAGRCVRDLC